MDGLLEDFSGDSFELDFSQSFSGGEAQEEELDEEEFESEEPQEDDPEGEESDDYQDEESDEDLEEEELEDDDSTSYSGLIEHLVDSGIIPDDLELEVDDSEEGLSQIFEAVVEKKFESLLENLSPMAKRLLEVEQRGGDIEEAFKVFDDVDYSSIDLSDEDVRREILIDYYKEINPRWNDSKITKKVDTVFDLGDDEEEAQEAQEHFIEKQEQDRQAYLASIERQNQEREAAMQQELDTYHEIIDKTDGFAGLKFSDKKDKEAFREYLFKKGKDGLTQYEKDTQEEESRLTQAFYAYKKFSFETVKKQAKTEATVKIKKLATRFKDVNQGGGRQENTRRTDTGFSIGSLDF